MDSNRRFWLRGTAIGMTFLLLPFVLVINGCGAPQSLWTPGKSPKVLASFPPLYCFATNVLGSEHGEVHTLMAEKDPHHFNTTIQDALLLREADFFFINGLGLDDSVASRMIEGAGNTRLVTVKLGDSLPKSELIPVGSIVDPHVWLGIPEACQMVQTIGVTLSSKMPDQAKAYSDNAAAYVERLKKLHEEGKKALADVKPEDRKIIAFHDSLRYFARSFDLEVAGVVEDVPGVAASAQRMQELIQTCKNKKVRIIVSEPGFDVTGEAQRLQENLRDIGVEIVEIDPLETALLKDLGPDYYEKVMRQNIQRLAAKMTRAKQ